MRQRMLLNAGGVLDLKKSSYKKLSKLLQKYEKQARLFLHVASFSPLQFYQGKKIVPLLDLLLSGHKFPQSEYQRSKHIK